MNKPVTAKEIKEIRSQYGLSQKSFALLLGIGPASMVRYEQGATPSKANANLIRAARIPQFMHECLENDGKSIPNRQRASAERYLYEHISLDSKEYERTHEDITLPSKPTMSMDEMYHYTLQQEILNEQAANLIGDLISIKLAGGIGGSANDVFESLLNRLSRLKPTIVDSDMLEDKKLSEIRGFLECATEIIAHHKAKVNR